MKNFKRYRSLVLIIAGFTILNAFIALELNNYMNNTEGSLIRKIEHNVQPQADSDDCTICDMIFSPFFIDKFVNLGR